MSSSRFLHAMRVMGSTAGLVDRAVVAAMSARGRHERARADAMPHDERIAVLTEIHRVYEGDALVADVARFFPSPPRSELGLRRVRSGVWEAAWPSAFEPFLAEVAERYLSRVENRTARARLYLAGSADAVTRRPAIIAVHGYMGGQWLIEENAWPIEWLLRRGLDVVLPVLPLHAGRGGAHRGAPAFPSSDPRLTNEGFRQAVTDIRTLVRWLRERGAPKVGVMGMSLGGYTSALTATVTDEIDFVMPMIPLASIADFAREQGRLGDGVRADEQHAALERANWIVSPLARPLRVPGARALVVAAENDRITPVAHAIRLARHFGCEMRTIAGGHLLQIGRSDAFRALAALLERDGIIAPARGRS
ncbi:MAG: alpha/beta hydrolase family protein [Labilithrix sp.]|nr:alpha/beta hydrolase family protein [Labilithrix sp.]MBX3223861.1 alpha/beta hydrolase family protein [Labilithrix sp.]